METNKLDSKIKKIISESGGFYDSEADKSKEIIWQQIQLKKENKTRPFLLRAMVAACILLLISTSVITVSNIKADREIKKLIELNCSLRNQIDTKNQDIKLPAKVLAETDNKMPDTVYVEKKVLVPGPVDKTTRITDTVYIERKVFIEKEVPQELTAEEKDYPAKTLPRTTTNSKNTQILIRNNMDTEKKKERKLQIKFGSNREQNGNGTLAFSTEL